jgi:DNA-directed RNA polymerase specialized sigma24 family protein
MELAFLAMREHSDIYKRIRKAVKRGDIAEDLSSDALAKAARKAEVISAEEEKALKHTEKLRISAIAVDSFAKL